MNQEVKTVQLIAALMVAKATTIDGVEVLNTRIDGTHRGHGDLLVFSLANTVEMCTLLRQAIRIDEHGKVLLKLYRYTGPYLERAQSTHIHDQVRTMTLQLFKHQPVTMQDAEEWTTKHERKNKKAQTT